MYYHRGVGLQLGPVPIGQKKSTSRLFLSLITGFLFEAGGRTFRPVVSHSKSGTLMPIFEGFLIFFIIIIFFT